MSRATKTTTAAVLAFAIAGFPVVLDRCAEACDAHHVAVASAASCHRGASAAIRIGRVPASCGHDHAAVVAAEKDRVLTGRSIDVVMALESRLSLPISPSPARDTFSPSPPGRALTLDRHSLPLRV